MIESKTSVSVVNNEDKQDNNDGKYGDEFNHINMFGISPHKNVFAHLKVYGVQGWIKCGSGEHRSREITRKIEEVITLM